jgi:hypothetical protein
LQRIARRREKKLPRRLSFLVQGDLHGKHRHTNSSIKPFNGTKYVRPVERCGCFLVGIANTGMPGGRAARER